MSLLIERKWLQRGHLRVLPIDICFVSGSWLTESGAFLDNNHSHFLLVDDGSEGKYGVEIPFRGSLEKYIMSKAMASKLLYKLFSSAEELCGAAGAAAA